LQSRNGPLKIRSKLSWTPRAIRKLETFRRAGAGRSHAAQPAPRGENISSFAGLAVRLGAERGLVFNEATVQNAVQEKRREWLERWI